MSVTAALVVIVKPGDVGLNAVHRRHLKRRRRGGNADTHRMQLMSLRAQHLRNVRHVPFRKRALEHLARKVVDLHDDKTPPYPLGPAAVPESPDQAVERALQEEEETVQRSGPRRVVGRFIFVVHAGISLVKQKLVGARNRTATRSAASTS